MVLTYGREGKILELGTTSAVLSFAIELNTKSKQYYDKIQEMTYDLNLAEVLQILQKHQMKRSKRLQQFRRELVTEMILEPIHGFNSEDYELTIELDSAMDSKALIAILIHIEKTMKRYLQMAADKTDFLPELKDQLQLLAEDSANNIQILENLENHNTRKVKKRG